LGNRQWDLPALRTLLGEVLPRDSSFEDFEVEHDFPAIGRKVMLLNARRLVLRGDVSELILLAIEDMTALRQRQRQLQFVTDHAPVLIAHCDPDLRYKFVNVPYAARFGLHPRDLVGKPIADVLGPEVYARIRPHVEEALAGRRVEFEADLPYEGI